MYMHLAHTLSSRHGLNMWVLVLESNLKWSVFKNYMYEGQALVLKYIVLLALTLSLLLIVCTNFSEFSD